jgi:hypothetical protein
MSFWALRRRRCFLTQVFTAFRSLGCLWWIKCRIGAGSSTRCYGYGRTGSSGLIWDIWWRVRGKSHGTARCDGMIIDGALCTIRCSELRLRDDGVKPPIGDEVDAHESRTDLTRSARSGAPPFGVVTRVYVANSPSPVPPSVAACTAALVRNRRMRPDSNNPSVL